MAGPGAVGPAGALPGAAGLPGNPAVPPGKAIGQKDPEQLIQEEFGKLEEIIATNPPEAKKLGKKVSLEKLCKGLTGLYHVMAVRILHSLKLEPLYENYPRQPRQFYSNQKRLIPKLVRMRMSYPDMSYFLDISYSMLIKQVRKMGIKSKAGSITGIGYKHRSYQLASQIYEAKAAGFRKYSDIAELLDTSREIVKDAFDNKKIIAPPIIRVLRIRYNDPDYNKPYKKPQES